LRCADGETACREVREALDARWPKLCTDSGCRVAHDWQLPTPSPNLIRVIVTDTKHTAEGYVITGIDSQPRDTRICKGEYQTDKIIDADAQRILVERTTWCRAIEKGRSSGSRHTFVLGKLPFAPNKGDVVTVLVDPRQIRSGKQGEVETLTVREAATVAIVSYRHDALRWNETWQHDLAQFLPETQFRSDFD
jgi:hypothetical protein